MAYIPDPPWIKEAERNGGFHEEENKEIELLKELNKRGIKNGTKALDKL